MTAMLNPREFGPKDFVAPSREPELARQVVALGRLAQLELEVRQAESVAAVCFIAANDTFRIVSYEYATVWLSRGNRIAATSGAIEADQMSPAIRWLRAVAAHLARKPAADLATPLSADAIPAALATGLTEWLPASAVWVPLTGPKRSIAGGLIVARAQPFLEGERRLLARLGSAYGEAITAHAAPSSGHGKSRLRRSVPVAAVVLAAGALLALPIRATVLADAKVAAHEPAVVAAPLDGVIKRMIVRPNQDVAIGDPLFHYEAAELRSQEDVTAKRVTVLRAETLRAEAQVFVDQKAKGEIGILRAKLAEGEAELAYARDKLARVEVKAAQAGVALFDDPGSFDGRLVRVGERIVTIANPDRARLEIHLAVEDALLAELSADVEFFLAAAPGEPIRARITKVSYEPRPQANQTVAFVAEAEFEGAGPRPRLGLTGTAKVYGPTVSLGYSLLRKPLASLRRMSGF